MNVPVAIFRYVSGDRSTGLIAIESLVFIDEDVITITTKFGIDFVVLGRGIHLFKDLEVIFSYWASDVVVKLSLVFFGS